MSRIVEVSERRVYHKFIKLEVTVPDFIKDEDVGKWLTDNDHWAITTEEEYDNALLEYGSGTHEYDGMDEEGVSCETRYDIYQTNKVQTYGGHLNE
tara:strand:+ start:9130 stop:9417 length:288 start_codon:yes stop_codon:yes gene_type:complete